MAETPTLNPPETKPKSDDTGFVIYKYDIVGGEDGPFYCRAMIPAECEILKFAISINQAKTGLGPVLWAKHKKNAPKVPRKFIAIDTGVEFPVTLELGPYLGTLDVPGSVTHVFATPPKIPNWQGVIEKPDAEA